MDERLLAESEGVVAVSNCRRRLLLTDAVDNYTPRAVGGSLMHDRRSTGRGDGEELVDADGARNGDGGEPGRNGDIELSSDDIQEHLA